MQLLAPAHCGQTFRLLLFVFSLGVLLSAFDAWRRLFDRDMTLSRIFLYVCGICASVCVCVGVLTAADCCETHRESSLFPFQSEAQATSITTDRQYGRKEESGAGRAGRREE